MDREIKFRAWFSGIPAMVEFGLGENNIDVYDSIDDKFTVDINNADSIMQYTGLKDRNGKEIYFKDIVKDPSGNYFVVEWYEQEMRIVLKRQDVLYGFNVPLYEVVGNVFENPELL